MSNPIQSTTKQLPVIAGIEVTSDTEGRFNLNALHKAHLASHPELHRNSKQPADWLKLEGTKELIAEVFNSEDSCFYPVHSKAGRYGGTFVTINLAYAYAMWISPSFHLKVIRAFDALQTEGVAVADHATEDLLEKPLDYFAKVLEQAMKIEEGRRLNVV